MSDDPLEVASIADPLERVRAAQARHDEYQAGAFAMWDIRRDTMIELVEGGMKPADLARELDLTPQRVSQILNSYMTPGKRALRDRAAARRAGGGGEDG